MQGTPAILEGINWKDCPSQVKKNCIHHEKSNCTNLKNTSLFGFKCPRAYCDYWEGRICADCGSTKINFDRYKECDICKKCDSDNIIDKKM